MQQAHSDIRKDFARKMLVHFLGRLHGLRFRFLDHRIHDIGLPAFVDLLFQKAVNALDVIGGDVLGDDGLAAGRQLIDDGDIQIAVDGERQRARNRRRGHHQHVRDARPCAPDPSAA